MHRRSLAEIATGLVVLLVTAGFLAYAIAHSGRSTGSGYPLFAHFDHIDGLGPGSDVRIAGVKVGSVTDTRVDPSTFLAAVTFTVQNSIKLPKDTGAEITSEGLLGGKYINLSPGGDETVLKPGQEITITQGSISIEQLLGKFVFSMGNMANKPAGSGGGQPGTQGESPPALK
ncbi:MAG: outer membrane lipid asymmetry maintenance protein MlaD [Acetobacteraceae bacterium]|nr:outer membrane lipid asymmetry maintenance protein MlaD [Acetobacteraceae bacterium]